MTLQFILMCYWYVITYIQDNVLREMYRSARSEEIDEIKNKLRDSPTGRKKE